MKRIMRIIKNLLLVFSIIFSGMHVHTTTNYVDTKPVIKTTKIENRIKQPVVVTSADVTEAPKYDNLDFLANVVAAEAGNQGLDGMRLVACVILNRVDHPDFPNTVSEVLNQKGQFSCVWDGGIQRWPATEESTQAVNLELANRTNNDILYFKTRGYHSFGTPIMQLKDHYFSGK